MIPRPNPLVSVITPFFNTADFLQEAIQSVLDQTYENWEYILVDNCSTDGSGNIAYSLAQRDARIRLVSSESFRSQVENYNFSLEHMSDASKYCKFVQADDYLYPACLEKMVALAESDGCIGIVAANYERGNQGATKRPPAGPQVLTGIQAARDHVLGRWTGLGSPTSVMYRAEVVRSRNPFFNLWSMHEDTEVCYEILLSWKLGFLREVLTHTRLDNESITTSASTFNWQLLNRVLTLKKYGPILLNPSELREESQRVLNEYMLFLGSAALSRPRDLDFWRYHARGLATIGIRLDWRMLLKALSCKLQSAMVRRLPAGRTNRHGSTGS